MPVVRRIDAAVYSDQYKLHVHHFAMGTYPEATGVIEGIPVNRFFIPLYNPSGAECYIKDGEQHFVLTPSNAYFIPVNHPAGVRLDPYLTFLSIQFNLECYKGVDIFSSFGQICEIPGTHWLEQAKCAYEEENLHYASALLHSLIFEFSLAIMKKMGDREWDPVSRFSDFQLELEYIQSRQDRLAQITVADLANVRNFSREYFTRSFTNSTGITPKRFLTDMLLNQAKRLLMRENIRIKEISEQLGFSSEFYFSKFYRKHTGLSPIQHRTLLLEKRI